MTWKTIESGVWKLHAPDGRIVGTVRAAESGYTWRVFGVAFGVAGTLRDATRAATQAAS